MLGSKKTDRIMEAIEKQVRDGKLPIGSKLPSERDLAREFGVNLLTVNKAMARLEDAGVVVRGRGRGGSRIAKFPLKKSIVIVCDLLHLMSSEHRSTDEILARLSESAHAHGYAPHFMPGRGGDVDDFLQSLSVGSSIWNEVKGVVSFGWKDGMDERFEKLGIPLVALDRRCKRSVVLDLSAMGRMAAGEMLRVKAKNIMVMRNARFPDGPHSDPVKAFTQALAGSSAKISCAVSDELTCAAGERWARRLQKELKEADALFITDDNLAEGFGRALTEIELPKTVVTHANRGLVKDMPGSFKRIAFDLGELAESAVSMLSEVMNLEAGSVKSKRALVEPFFETLETGQGKGKRL